MNAREYYLTLQDAIHAAPHVLRSEMRFEEIDENECYVSGILLLIGSFELFIAEYVVTMPSIVRPKYRYHLQDANGALVSRWDNAPHHRDVSSFPEHRHDDHNQAHASEPMDVPRVLDAVVPLIFPAQS